MTDFQEIMNREPKFRPASNHVEMAFVLNRHFYEFDYEGEQYYITDYDFNKEFGGDSFDVTSKAIVFAKNSAVYGYVSRDLLLALVEQEPHNVEIFHNFMTHLKKRLTK